MADPPLSGRDNNVYAATSDDPVQTYEVGRYNEMQSRPKSSELNLHHVVQGHPAEQVIDGYDYATAPVIALPGEDHRTLAGQNIRGEYQGSARDLLAKGIYDLWGMDNRPPTSALQELLGLNKTLYPEAFRKDDGS